MQGSRTPLTRQRKQSKSLQVVNAPRVAAATNSNVYYNQQQQQQNFVGRPTESQNSEIYNFNTDRGYRYLDVNLLPYARDLTSRFVAWIVLTFFIELILLAWPITATVLWSTWAALTWISFGYALRLLFLLATVIGVGSRVHRLAGRPVTRFQNPHRIISLTLGTAFATSAPLKMYYLLALVQGILTILTLLLTLATAPMFSSNSKNLVLGLSLGFQILSILQSLSWPGIIYRYAIRGPVASAVASARRRRTRARNN